MNIINPLSEDYHMHSSTFSDGFCSIDELVAYAGKIGLTKIAITDHSDAATKNDGPLRTWRKLVQNWKNVHNDVRVVFGVEADLLDEQGSICATIDGQESDFVILSYHDGVYSGDASLVKEGFIKAINLHHEKIHCIGHVCKGLSREDALAVIRVANEHRIPVELNAKYFRENMAPWSVVLEHADQIMINSDAHLLNNLRDLRPWAYRQLGLST